MSEIQYSVADAGTFLIRRERGHRPDDGEEVFRVVVTPDETHIIAGVGPTGTLHYAVTPSGALEIFQIGQRDEPLRTYGSWLYVEQVPYKARASGGRVTVV